MLAWGDAHLADEDGPPVRVEHADCGAPVHVEVRCAEGHLVDTGARLRWVPGPGAHRAGHATDSARGLSTAHGPPGL